MFVIILTSDTPYATIALLVLLYKDMDFARPILSAGTGRKEASDEWRMNYGNNVYNGRKREPPHAWV